jgi:branched-chain amino acid transport system permease protein
MPEGTATVARPRRTQATIQAGSLWTLARRHPWPVVGVIALVAVLANGDDFQFHLLDLICIFGILACSLNLVVGYAGQVSLCQASFFGIGAYVTAVLVKHGWSYWATVPVGMTLAAAAGVLVGLPALKIRSHYLGMVTIGAAYLFSAVVGTWTTTGAATGLYGIKEVDFFGYALADNLSFMPVAVGALVLSLLTMNQLVRSHIGRAWMSLRDDDIAAESFGVRPLTYKVLVFALAAAYAGLAGGLFAEFSSAISPASFGVDVSIQALIMIVVGGLASLPGAVVGAAIVILLPAYLTSFSRLENVVYAAAIIVVMIVTPGGLVGIRKGSTARLGGWARNRLVVWRRVP